MLKIIKHQLDRKNFKIFRIELLNVVDLVMKEIIFIVC